MIRQNLFSESRLVFHLDHDHDHSHDSVSDKKKERSASAEKKESKEDKTLKTKQKNREARLKISKEVDNNLEAANNLNNYFTNRESKQLNEQFLLENRDKINEKTLSSLEKLIPGIIKKYFCAEVQHEGKNAYKFLHAANGEKINNERLNNHLGLAEIFANEPAVRAVTVVHEGNSYQGERNSGAYAGSFFDKGNYLAVKQPDLFYVSKEESKEELKKRKSEFKKKIDEQVSALKNLPDKYKKILNEKAENASQIKEAVTEIVKNGGDARLAMITLLDKKPELFTKGQISGVDIRWEMKMVRLQAKFEAISGKSAKDENGNYNLGFLAFYSKIEGLPQAMDLKQFCKVYEDLCGKKLQGNNEDIAAGEKLAKAAFSSSSSENAGRRGEYNVAQVLYRSPKLNVLWNDIKNWAKTNSINLEEDLTKQNGFVFSSYQKKIAKLLADSRATELIKNLQAKDKSWKLNIGVLPNVDAYLNGKWSQEYREKTAKKLNETSNIEEALDILSKTPRDHVYIEFPRGTDLGLKSCYGVRAPIPSVGIMKPNMHPAVDIWNGPRPNFELRAPNVACKVVGFYDGHEYVTDRDGNRKTWTVGGRTRYRTRTCWITLRYFDPRLGSSGKYVELSYAHLKPGTVAFNSIKKGQVLKPGQVIALAGNTGRSTAPHLHLSVKHIDPDSGRKTVADPLTVLPPQMQAKVIKWRRENVGYDSLFRQYKSSHYQNPQTDKVADDLARQGIEV